MNNTEKTGHFSKISKEELKELSRKGGLNKNPKKGLGSLSPERRQEIQRKALKARLEKIRLQKGEKA